MIYTAILIACAIVTPIPQDCKTHEMRFEGPANPAYAVVMAQTMTVEWLKKHPDLKPVRLTIRSGVAS